MFEQMVMVAAVSAVMGLLLGLLVGPAGKMVVAILDRYQAMPRTKTKRKPGRPRMTRTAKTKTAQMSASSRQSKALPIELAAPVVLESTAKPKRKVGRPSKAELARRAQEAAESGAVQVAPTTTVRVITEPAVAPPELTSGQIQEIAVYAAAECHDSQTDRLEKVSSS
jgi:hypothetical protein